MSASMVLAFLALMLAALGLGWLMGRRPVAAPEPVRVVPPPPEPVLLPPDRISIEAIADPALIVEGARAVAANAAARTLFGARIEGGDLRLVLRHPAVLDAVSEAAAKGTSIRREVNGLGSGNSAWRLRAVEADDGRVLVVFEDITQARLTERMRVDFVANASHELRTPLATLSGFIETLLGPAAEDEPARRRFLSIMANEAGRMSRLIDDLLSLSRIELDKYVRPSMSLDLVSVFGDVGKTLAMRLDQDQRQLVLKISDGLPPVVGDRDQILQVLHNLVSNALKYGQTGTPITVRAGVENGAVKIVVADVGEGIAPEHLPRLTERFYRVDSQRSRKMGGTGLGLAIVKHIVERHRGRLEIESRQGEGTEVSFTLPIARAEAPAPALS
ncbi:MAG: sensor histidine kinase [Polymorphobacter sp.]|uniref:sensor histidine kinase n=1 Tax=Polymorphobacter sp. TaxID=1909290 RepID=UPI003A89B3C0